MCFLCCLRFGLFGYFAKWLASRTVSKWCLCRGVSLRKDQLLQDPLTFKQNSSYELFWFFHYIFSFFFTVLVVHPHHDYPVTTVLTHYFPVTWYSLLVLKVPLNTNQPTNPNSVLMPHILDILGMHKLNKKASKTCVWYYLNKCSECTVVEMYHFSVTI